MNIFNLIPVNSTKLPSVKGLLLGVSMIAITGAASAQTVMTNNGALISVTPGATMIVKNSSMHNAAGYISNAGTFTVENNLVNDDTMSGGGTTGFYRVHDNWVNNHIFIPDRSNVELYGDNQQITGSQPTTYYDLTLTGTGIKTQTLDANLLDSLRLNDRELATGVFNMHILNRNAGVATFNTVGGNYGFVSSLGAGRLAWDINSGAYLYPVGSSVGVTRFRPVIVRPDNPANQTIEIRMANNDATNDALDRAQKDSDICQINDKFYHLVGRSAGAITDSVQLSFFYDTIADNKWYVLANWQTNIWHQVGNTAPGAGFITPFSALSIGRWGGFSNEPLALARPNPGIDTTLTLVSRLHCFNDSTGAISVTLNNGTPPLSYHWSSGDSTLNLSGADAGSYTLTIADQLQCSRNFGPFVITQPAEIRLTDNITNLTCNSNQTGSFTVLVDSAILPIRSYTWSKPGADSTSNTISNLSAGAYAVTVTDANGCKSIRVDSVKEPEVLTATADAGDGLTCFESGDGSINLSISGGITGSPLYSYSWSDSTSLNQEDRNGLTAGFYSVTITDRNGCKDSISSIEVKQPELFTLTASADTTIAIGYVAELEVLSTNGGNAGNITYAWTPVENLTNPTGTTTEARPVNTTTYTITGTDIKGCKAFDTVRVRVDSNLVTVPDGFIPDGNNITNRTFHLLTSATVSVVELKVFNRWGQLISDDVNGWDGNYKGRPQPMDTYVFQATIRLPNGSNMQKSGDFILIR